MKARGMLTMVCRGEVRIVSKKSKKAVLWNHQVKTATIERKTKY